MEKKPESGKFVGPLLSLALIASSIAYAFSQRTGGPAVPTGAPSPSTTREQSAVGGTATTTSSYKDGTYVGAATDAYYGTVQVQAVIQNGKIADVTFLQYPDSRGHSRAVNGRAMPILASEAIAAQSAQVDAVSGATFTSAAFKQSLISALTQAKV